MAHTLTTHFRRLLQDIQPTEDRLDLAKTLPAPVREYLSQHEDFATRYPHTRLAGSYAQFLTVGDVKDVDFLIRVDGDPEEDDPTARSVLTDLVDALKGLPEYLGRLGDSQWTGTGRFSPPFGLWPSRPFLTDGRATTMHSVSGYSGRGLSY